MEKEITSKQLVDDKRNCIYWKKKQCTFFNVNKCIIDEGIDTPKMFCYRNKWIERRLKLK